MRGLYTAISLGTLSLTGLVGAGVGIGWFLSAASLHQDQTESHTTS